MALVSGVLRQFLLDRGELPDSSLVAMVPVSVHDKSDRPGRNQVSGMFSSLQTHIADPAERIKAIADANSVAKCLAFALYRQKGIRIEKVDDLLTPNKVLLAWDKDNPVLHPVPEEYPCAFVITVNDREFPCHRSVLRRKSLLISALCFKKAKRIVILIRAKQVLKHLRCFWSFSIKKMRICHLLYLQAC